MSWGDWIKFFWAGWGLPFTVYVILQFLALRFMKGPGRTGVVIPIPLMLLVLILTLTAYRGGSNLWPLFLILSSPIAVIFIVVIWFIQILRRRRATPN